LTNIPAANPDVETVVSFPDYADHSFPGGEKVTVLLGLRNTGNDDVNVKYIAGSLNIPANFEFYVTNFTASAYGDAIVKSRREATFEYSFSIDPQFAGHALQLALTAFYDEAGVAYATTFYNASVPVLDPKVAFDRELAVIYLTLAGVAALILAAALNAMGLGHLVPFKGEVATKLSVKKTSVQKIERGTTQANDSDWLVGTSFARQESKKSKRKNK
jgi:hypothetical protein